MGETNLKKIVIINCGGNVLSLVRAINKYNFNVNITNDLDEIKKATHIFLPGVGAFKNAMKKLKQANLINLLQDLDFTKINLMGICLGMQILMSEGEEDGYCKGLNLINGKVKKINLQKIKNKDHKKIPNIGWYQLQINKTNFKNTIIKNSNIDNKFYFIHSYYAKLEKDEECVAHIEYGSLNIPAIIKKNKIYGCQFHPEKSRENGLTLIENFLKLD